LPPPEFPPELPPLDPPPEFPPPLSFPPPWSAASFAAAKSGTCAEPENVARSNTAPASDHPDASAAGIMVAGDHDENHPKVPAIWMTFSTMNATRSFFITEIHSPDMSIPSKFLIVYIFSGFSRATYNL
jgi:hypothetical protein